MTSVEQGENGIFWEQMEELGPNNGAWNSPKCLKNLLNPQSCKISLYLRSGGTTTLMTSGEKGENVAFLGTNGEIGAHQGRLESHQVSQLSSQSPYFRNQFLSPCWGYINPHEK
jgi:hypothetical protein